MIDQQRWNTYLRINFKDRTLHLCEQNAEAFFVTMKFIVDHAVFTEKQKGNQIPTMDTHIYIYINIYIYDRATEEISHSFLNNLQVESEMQQV